MLKNVLKIDSKKSSSYNDGSGPTASLLPVYPGGHVIPMDRRKPPATESFDEPVSLALLTLDQELARTLAQVYEISTALQTKSPNVRTLSKALRNVLVCAARQFELEKELRSLALTDPLTGLYNRRAFLALAAQQLRVAARRGETLVLFFADLDHLKQINDDMGHREGDAAIIRTARALQATFRKSDIVARIGGDEFAVLALEASCQDVKRIRSRVHKALKTVNAGGSRYKVSLSMGTARYNAKNAVSLSELIARADEAMYAEKRAARGMRTTAKTRLKNDVAALKIH